MSGPVVFSVTDFVAMFPEFKDVPGPRLALYFDIADGFFKNEGSNPAYGSGLDRMTRLSYLVTAHIAQLLSPRDASGAPGAAGAPTGLVGRITSASEGSVSVSTELPGGGDGPTEGFFSQTAYGLMFWAATAQYRTARYIAQPTRVPSTRPYYFRRGY